MENLDSDLLLKVLAAIIGTIGSIYQIRNSRFTSRSTLKTDLEILKQIEKEDPNYIVVSNSITNSINKIYGTDQKKFKIYSYVDLMVGMLFIFGFGGWAIYLSYEEFSFWSIPLGFFGIIGFGGILNGLDPKKAQK